MLENNVNFLKKYDANIIESLKMHNKKEENYFFESVDTKSCRRSLILNMGGKELYFHSKYDPIREAKSIVDLYKDIDDSSRVLFIGTGLGYHIEEILVQFPNIKCYIYEPIPKLMNEFLKEFDMPRFRKNINGFNIGENYYGQSLDRFLDVYKNVKIVILPSHENYFKDEVEKIMTYIVDYLKSQKDSIWTNLGFQERWIVNGMKNLKYTLRTPNILLNNKDKFKGETAILVAAGPSLDYEVNNLKYIKKNEKAHIFAIGSAINSMIKYDIYPDFAVSYDPKPTNHGVFKKLKTKNIVDIPLIYGSSIGYETLIDYPGDMYHVVTSQDTTFDYYLNSKKIEEDIVVADASTVAVITLQILNYLGFSKIVFVGQNLAYIGNKNHSKGVHYSKDVTDEFLENDAIEINSVAGEKIYTNEGYLAMKEQIEVCIKAFSHIDFINTTIDGANIEGAPFEKLEKVIKDLGSSKKIAINKKTGVYDRAHLKKQYKEMQREYYGAKRINSNYRRTLKQIKNARDRNDFANIESLYVKLNDDLKKIENNDFYKTYILPIQRVEYKFLADSIDTLNEIADSREKADSILEKFTNFIDLSEINIKKIDPIYDEVKEVILEYLSEGD